MTCRGRTRVARARVLAVAVMSLVLTAGESLAQMHFVFTGNTGNNATVGIPTASHPCVDGVPLSVGDEIGAFSPEGLCVGAAAWNGDNTSITVWGDNDQTTQVDGIKSGEKIVYRVWLKALEREVDNVSVGYLQGDGLYAPDKIFVLDSLDAISLTSILKHAAAEPVFHLDQNSPNPFNPTTTISYQISAVGEVRLEVYDALGRKVTTLVDRPQSAGAYTADFNGSSLASGIYFYRLSFSGIDGQRLISVKKLLLIK